METTNSSSASVEAPAPKKGSGKKVAIIIIAIILALACIGVIIFLLWPKITGKKIGAGNATSAAAKFPDIIPGLTVSQKISAKTGGQISATNPEGVKITIDIPAGSLKDDTTVTIDPAEPADDEDNNNPDDGDNGNGDNNNPPEDEPADESGDEPADDGGGNPPAAPTCPNGTCGAGETCSSCPADCGVCPPPPPPLPTCPNGTCGAGETCSSCPSDCGVCPPPPPPPDGGFPFGGFVIGPNTLVFNPSATATFTFPGNRRIAPGAGILVSVDRNGRSHVIPTTPSADGSSYTAPVGGGGAVIPDDSSDNGGGGGDSAGGGEGGGTTGGGGGNAGGVGDPANNAAIASGGKCTPEFLEAIKGEKDFAEGAPGHAAYDAALRDCLEVDKLREQCLNNPIVLRRRHFETRINIAEDLDVEVATELKNLLASCVAKYEIAGQGVSAEAGVQTTVNMNANICGYIDDEWSGTYSYVIVVPPAGGGSCIGTLDNFRLPFGGGNFVIGVRCTNTATVLGRTMSIPGGGFVVTGSFIEPTRLLLNLYGEYIVKDTNIVLKEKTCNEAAYPVPPPLVPPSDDDMIPLMPIPVH